MLPFTIGKWKISADGIEHVEQEYYIPADRIAETGLGDRENLFDWVVQLTEKTWVSREDAYALNSAIVYAMAQLKIDVPPNISWVETLIEQESELQSRKL